MAQWVLGHHVTALPEVVEDVGGEGAMQKSNFKPPRGAWWETLQQQMLESATDAGVG